VLRIGQRTRGCEGTLDTLLVHPREGFKSAIAARAAAIVLVHNHPSGDPSHDDCWVLGALELLHKLRFGVLDV